MFAPMQTAMQEDPTKPKPPLAQAAQSMGGAGSIGQSAGNTGVNGAPDGFNQLPQLMGAGSIGQSAGNTGVDGAPSGLNALPQLMGAGSIGQSAGNTGVNGAAATTGSVGQAAGGTGTVPNSTQPWYTNQDVGTFQNWAQTRYGRQATPEELARIGANSTDMASAQAFADTLARQQGWQGPAAPTTPTPTQTTTTPYTPGPGVPPPQTPTAPPPSEMDALAQQRIQQLLGTNTGQVDTGSAEYQGQLGSFKRGQQSAMERAKRNAASRMQGQSGALEGALTNMDLAAAQGTGDFEAQLAGQQLMRQREDLRTGLGLAQERGMADQARSLQERLASVDANLRQQGLNLQGELGRGSQALQGELGRGDLDLRRYLGRGQLGLGMLGTLLQNQQANNQLGFNYASLGNTMNAQLLQQLLGGL